MSTILCQSASKYARSIPSKLKHIILFLSLVLILGGCATNKYYNPKLVMGKDSTTDVFVSNLGNNNAIAVPENKKVKININEIRVGYLHRNAARGLFWDKGPRIAETKYYDVLGGRDLWLIADIVPREKGSLLRQKGKRIYSFTSIKGNQESFSFFPLSSKEQLIFDEEFGPNDTSSYEVKLKLYSVHGVDYKTLLLQAADSSIGKLLLDSAVGFVTATGNFLAKEVLDYFKKQTESDPLFIEEVLLKASADLEFSGSFILQTGESSLTEQKYALYDVVKSELDSNYDGNAKTTPTPTVLKDLQDNGARKGINTALETKFSVPEIADNAVNITKSNSPEKYEAISMAINGEQVKLPSPITVHEQYIKKEYQGIADDLTKSYIKFTIKAVNIPN